MPIIRINPVQEFDIAGMEDWLGRCAREGLRPMWIGASFSVFQRHAPGRVRYRLEPMRKTRTPPEDLLALYEDAGWHYICRADAFFLFAAEDPAAPEPYSDSASRAESLSALTRSMQRYALHRVLAALFLFACFAVILFLQPGRLLWALLQLPLTGLLWLILVSARNVRSWLRLRSLRGKLADGVVPSAAGRGGRAGNFFCILLSALCVIALVTDFSFRHMERPLAQGEAPSLTELEELYPVTSCGGTFTRTSFHLLAPVQYLTEETAQGPELPRDLELPSVSWHYSPSLEMAYYRLTLPAMAPWVARSQMELFRAVNLRWTFQEVDYPGADYVLLADSSRNSQMAALAREGHLVVYCYNGAENLLEHLDLLFQPIAPTG